MPHLIFGGRLWRFASDELSLPASCAASSRGLWLVMLIIIIALTAQSIEECADQGYYILGYLLASLCVQAINVVCELCIIRHSIRGTMVDSKPRSEVHAYLAMHLWLAVLQLACALYGVLVISLDFIPCNSVISESGMTVLLYVVVISQLCDIGGILCCATMFSSRTVDVDLHVDDNLSPYSAHSSTSRASGSGPPPPGLHLEHPDLGLVGGLVGPSGDDLLQWEKRCGSLCRRLQLLTCNILGGSGVGNDMATVGRVFSNFFHHEGFLDVVPSDVVAGFLLVRFQQKIAKLRNREARVKLISEQGVQFARQPSKYGAKSTVVLKVPAYSHTPALQDAKDIVTAAKEGVVLRPLSVQAKETGLLEMTDAPVPPVYPSSPATSIGDTTIIGDISLKDPKSDIAKDVAYVMTTNSPSVPALTTDKSSGSSGDSSSRARRAPAAASRYSPRAGGGAGGETVVKWNSSEDEPADLLSAGLSPPSPGKSSKSSPLSASPSPLATSFKTRKSYFSALEVLERESSLASSAPSPHHREQVQQYLGSNDTEIATEDGGLDHDLHLTINFIEMSDVTRFSYFALAAYSTLMFLYMYPCSGCCKLCAFGCCHETALNACCGPDSSSPRAHTHRHGTPAPSSGSSATTLSQTLEGVDKLVEHDNRCHTHESAMRQMVQAPNTELVYAQFSNNIETRPYAVFLDYEKEALVITVRGTLSLEDCVADAMSEPEPLDEIGEKYGFNGVGRFAHSGFLKSAQWIADDLRKHPHVSRLLDSVAGQSPVGMTMDRDSRDRDEVSQAGSVDSNTPVYTGNGSSSLEIPLKPRVFSRLAIVGHSLGAGVAALLALLLKQEFPTLHCYGYGAPGSTMDAESAHEAKSFVTSVVLGDDMVGSLSFHSLSVLREEVLDSIVRSRSSKMSILQTTMFKDCSESLLEELLYESGQEPASSFRTMFLKYKAHMERQRASFVPCQLHIPGKAVHLRQIGKEKDRSSLMGSVARVFVPVVEPDLFHFAEIKVSATMITDHMPDLYVKELNAMLHDWAVERHAQQASRVVVGGAAGDAPSTECGGGSSRGSHF